MCAFSAWPIQPGRSAADDHAVVGDARRLLEHPAGVRGDARVEIQGKKIYLNLIGACAGCMMEHATMGGIQAKLCEALGELVQVLPARQLAKALAQAE